MRDEMGRQLEAFGDVGSVQREIRLLRDGQTRVEGLFDDVEGVRTRASELESALEGLLERGPNEALELRADDGTYQD